VFRDAFRSTAFIWDPKNYLKGVAKYDFKNAKKRFCIAKSGNYHPKSLEGTTYFFVSNVKRMKSILLSKEKLCLYIHESLELHGSLWKLMIANTSGGGE